MTACRGHTSTHAGSFPSASRPRHSSHLTIRGLAECHSNDGTPNGYGVYEVQGSELRWRYKSTGQPMDVQLRAYARGADPAAPTEIVANVWDWDPAWTVVWYEDGERRGAMTRRPGRDPRAVAEQTGPERPPRRTWVEPAVTNHVFYARPSSAAREVRVEATDRWGARHSAVVPR